MCVCLFMCVFICVCFVCVCVCVCDVNMRCYFTINFPNARPFYKNQLYIFRSYGDII